MGLNWLNSYNFTALCFLLCSWSPMITLTAFSLKLHLTVSFSQMRHSFLRASQCKSKILNSCSLRDYSFFFKQKETLLWSTTIIQNNGIKCCVGEKRLVVNAFHCPKTSLDVSEKSHTMPEDCSWFRSQCCSSQHLLSYRQPQEWVTELCIFHCYCHLVVPVGCKRCFNNLRLCSCWSRCSECV